VEGGGTERRQGNRRKEGKVGLRMEGMGNGAKIGEQKHCKLLRQGRGKEEI
jgi:hypothetical protein